LLAGVRSKAESRLLEKQLLTRFSQRGRLLAPSADGWLESGSTLRTLVEEEGIEHARVSKAFGNDVLLAVTCREHGVCVVTENVRNFNRIRRHLRFEFAAPWLNAS
jgi:predicted nucleic acid-binding protein